MDPFPPMEPAYEPAVPPSGPAWRDRIDHPRYAYYLALAGGVLILLCAFTTALFITALASFGALPNGWWFFDGEDPNDAFPEIPIMMGLWGLVTGGAVVLAALRVRERPDRAAWPGVVMAASGVLSFLALGGFLLGGVAAILAGVLAVAGSDSLFHLRAPRLQREPGL